MFQEMTPMMLPNVKKSKLRGDYRIWFEHDSEVFLKMIPQHLCLCSELPLKVNDWVLHDEGRIGQVTETNYNDAEEVMVDWDDKTAASRTSIIYLHKIEATNSNLLGLPRLGAFPKLFVEAKGAIKKVFVPMETYCTHCNVARPDSKVMQDCLYCNTKQIRRPQRDKQYNIILTYNILNSADLVKALEEGKLLEKDYYLAYPETYGNDEVGRTMQYMFMETYEGQRYIEVKGWGSYQYEKQAMSELLLKPSFWNISKYSIADRPWSKTVNT